MVKQVALEAKIRPVGNASLEKASLFHAARLYTNKESFATLAGGTENGRHCYIEKMADGDSPALRREATLGTLLDRNVSPNIVMMTRAFQEASGFKVGDQVRITLGAALPSAEIVSLSEVSGGGAAGPALDQAHYQYWEYVLADYLERAEELFSGMVFDGVVMGRTRRSFKVLAVNSQITSLARFDRASTVVRIENPESATTTDASTLPTPSLPHKSIRLSDVAGLGSQIRLINEFLAGFSGPFVLSCQDTSCALVLHGGRGTGKTFLLDRVAASDWGCVFRVCPGDKSSTIRDLFRQARAQQPSIILLDRLEELVRPSRANYDAVVDVLASELDYLAAEAAKEKALPRVVVLAACMDYVTDVPPLLRKPTRLGRHIMLPIPSAVERLEILKSLKVPLPDEDEEKFLRDIAGRTHAYTPEDLFRLVRKAGDNGAVRLSPDKKPLKSKKEDIFVSMDDLEDALRHIRPSAMQDINLRPPTVYWQDVGGQEKLKATLRHMIMLMTNEHPALRRVLTTVPKGLLLYGPPGCSKTLSAQAVATESGFNFFSVKGAELLNMYVGESERAVRQLFERARSASPSIIFFDEIDSIAGQRSGPGTSGGSGSRGASSVNMITTLLTEMDGFETLSGVLILAATNRPDAIDSALLRPGRFDQVLYVGPPNLEARRAVFEVHLKSKSVAEDVDTSELALRTEGYSGADIKQICAEAGIAVSRRYFDAVSMGMGKPNEDLLCIWQHDLLGALARTPRSITQQMLEGYEKWRAKIRPL